MDDANRIITGISKQGINRQQSETVQARIDSYFERYILESVKSVFADEGIEESEIIRSVLNSAKAHKRSAYKGMWSFMLHVTSSHITTREIHQGQVADEARYAAKELGLNADLAEFMANHHDDGHVSNGHKGEQILSSTTEKDGMGYITHNALGVVQLYLVEKMPEKIIEEIKRRRPEITTERLNKISKNLWKIFDGILSHNGEGTKGVISPDRDKDESKFYEDCLNSFIYKEYDKHIEPGTLEASLIRYLDIICYVSSDFTDGCNEGLITGPDETYMGYLNQLGISIVGVPKHELKEYIANEVKAKFISKIINYSKGKDEIGMGSEDFELLKKFRQWNYNHISSRGLSKEDNQIIPKAIGGLIDKYENILMETCVTNESFGLNLSQVFSSQKDKKRMEYEEKNGQRKLIHFAENMEPKLKEFIETVVRESARVSISEEVDIAYKLIKGEKITDKEKEKSSIVEVKERIDRFCEELRLLLEGENSEILENNAGKITTEYKDKLMMETRTSKEQSLKVHDERNQKYGVDSKRSLRLKTIEERIAKQVAVFFIGGADDEYLFELCSEAGIITEREIEILNQSYYQIPVPDDETREQNIGFTVRRQKDEEEGR